MQTKFTSKKVGDWLGWVDRPGIELPMGMKNVFALRVCPACKKVLAKVDGHLMCWTKSCWFHQCVIQ